MNTIQIIGLVARSVWQSAKGFDRWTILALIAFAGLSTVPTFVFDGTLTIIVTTVLVYLTAIVFLFWDALRRFSSDEDATVYGRDPPDALTEVRAIEDHHTKFECPECGGVTWISNDLAEDTSMICHDCGADLQ